MPPTAWTRRGRGEALGCAATQYIQLVSKRDYLSLERTPRPEEIQEDPPEQIENLEHPAFIARFGVQAKRMAFAVGTGEKRVVQSEHHRRPDEKCIGECSPDGQFAFAALPDVSGL